MGEPFRESSKIPTRKIEHARNYHFSVRIGLVTLKGSVFKASEIGTALKEAIDGVKSEYGIDNVDVKDQIIRGLRKLSVTRATVTSDK